MQGSGKGRKGSIGLVAFSFIKLNIIAIASMTAGGEVCPLISRFLQNRIFANFTISPHILFPHDFRMI